MRRRELTRIRHGDLVDFIGIQPDLPSPALEHAGSEPLLEAERHHRSPPLSSSRSPRVRWFFGGAARRGVLYAGDGVLGFATPTLDFLGLTLMG